jgi:hypothetical protein
MAKYYLLEVQKGKETRVSEFLQRIYGIEAKKTDVGEYLVCDESYRQVGDMPNYVKRARVATEQEIEQILGLKQPLGEGVTVSEGQNVLVVDGPYKSMVGTIRRIQRDGRVKVHVNVFGRMVPVLFQINQLGPYMLPEVWR